MSCGAYISEGCISRVADCEIYVVEHLWSLVVGWFSNVADCEVHADDHIKLSCLSLNAVIKVVSKVVKTDRRSITNYLHRRSSWQILSPKQSQKGYYMMFIPSCI